MRYVDRLAIVLALGFGWFGSTARADQPATQPAVPTSRILILPFSLMNGAEASPWLGKSIQQSLLADLMPSAPGRLLSADAEANDTAAAIAAGRTAKADFVVIGSFTTLDAPTGRQIRIVGQLVDVAHETALSGFKATGMYTDIFPLEDQVGKQIRRRLIDAGAIQMPVIVVGPSAVPDSQPVEVAQAPVIINEYQQAYGNPQPMIGGANDSGYNYYYGNPYSSGGIDLSSGLGFPQFIYGGGGFHERGSRGFSGDGFHNHGSGHGGNGSHGSGSGGASHGHH
jgi:TolB-like protein